MREKDQEILKVLRTANEILQSWLQWALQLKASNLVSTLICCANWYFCKLEQPQNTDNSILFRHEGRYLFSVGAVTRRCEPKWRAIWYNLETFKYTIFPFDLVCTQVRRIFEDLPSLMYPASEQIKILELLDKGCSWIQLRQAKRRLTYSTADCDLAEQQ